MQYNYKYRLTPDEAISNELLRHIDVCRQLYNHCLYELNESTDGIPTRYDLQGQLPDLEKWWSDLKGVHSKVLQMVLKRVYDNLSTLKAQKENGRAVGMLKWKRPRDYRSLTYNQTGFKLKNTSGRPQLWLSKIGDVPIQLHRGIPDDSTVKQVTVKREPTGEWFAVFGIETENDALPKPEVPEKCVGINVGILSYTHGSDGFSVGSLDLSEEREQLEREQRKLSRKEHGSANYRTQQRVVARRHADLKRKRHDFLHRLSAYYAREYDLVAVEDLDAKGLMELPSNSRKRAGAAWGTILRMLEYKCDREGTHYVPVDPRGTTKECSKCSVSTEKPLWVREHLCPSCGFEADRDANAALNIISRGLNQVGVVHFESTSAETLRVSDGLQKSRSDFRTPVETVLPTGPIAVPAQRVVEAGSPALTERTAQAVGE
ncbi:RNA-guided endonuclease InsQ/TnpB family protein [Halegenticoccus tardaugens]|uniref:RNA-guided endonuclease InsQ/TnpB family protein n=1 Tax=Halegenticoccus tardaugens TaxID=2071624 RepID=UPI00100BD670|nr:RNA-guided endonuclease TnpB family protein [Halegenticoccus tardaugens]